ARPQLTACLDYLRTGDTLAVWRIDRLGRSVADLTTIVNTRAQRGIQFRSLTEAIDTTTGRSLTRRRLVRVAGVWPSRRSSSASCRFSCSSSPVPASASAAGLLAYRSAAA